MREKLMDIVFKNVTGEEREMMSQVARKIARNIDEELTREIVQSCINS